MLQIIIVILIIVIITTITIVMLKYRIQTRGAHLNIHRDRYDLMSAFYRYERKVS
jgi:hypothetical protein